MTSKLALHFQQLPGWAGNTAARWVKVIDPPSENRWSGRLVIGRAYMPDEDSNRLVSQGAAGAEVWFRFLQPYVARAPYVHAWEGPNEPQPVADLAFATALGQFTKRLAELMHAAGLKVVGGCLSEGNPGGDEAQAKACYVAIAKGLAACDYEGFHCYWVMGYSHPEAGMNDWHAFRYRRNRRYATEAGITLPPLLITECGVDGGVVALPKRGWKTFAPTKGVYMEQLRQFDAGLAADPYVLCATVFTSGPTGDWSDFEVDEELAGMIDQHIASQGGPYMAAGGHTETFFDALKGEAQRKQLIQLNKNAALQKCIFADGFVPTSAEHDVVFGGNTYRFQRAEHLGTGKVRAYYCEVGHYDVVRFIAWTP